MRTVYYNGFNDEKPGIYRRMKDLKPIIAKNIIDLRKSRNLTQAELAQMLNYSDKAVSKWERAESIPDVTVLKEIADQFSVGVDYLLEAEHPLSDEEFKAVSHQQKRNRLIITLLSTSLVFLIATIAFVILGLYSDAERHGIQLWMVYVYAVPVALIVLLVFNAIWGKRQMNFLIITLLVWSILLCVYLAFLSYNIWLIFIIGIPAQIIILLFAGLKPRVG